MAGTSIMAPSSTAAGSLWPRALRCAFSVSTMSRGSAEFGNLRDHREHDPQLWPARRLEQGPELQPEQRRPVERQADRPPAHRRIVFLRLAQIGQNLVGADIEGAEGHRPRIRRSQDSHGSAGPAHRAAGNAAPS